MTEPLQPSQFAAFYRAVHGYEPFPWQTRLAERICSEPWPKSIDLPTASGKTSCIDIAVFAMAVTGRGPRRLFFVIDRRVVVDQAYENMQELEQALRKPKEEVLKQVAGRLHELGGEKERPVAAYQMRGGIYRDDAWVRSPLQPTLIATTVDQIGSRILFRGYGESDKTWPIHAALACNDSLILLDEAHCSRAFAETLSRIEDYRGNGWAAEDVRTPFAFVEMTATPSREASDTFRLNEDDYGNELLKQRLFAAKPAELVTSKARPKDHDKFARELLDQALELAQQPGMYRIAVMVNRVRTARRVHGLLLEQKRPAELLIGRMRPVDRESLPESIQAITAGKSRTPAETIFVVATQCLEVGADLDFDALVTECASIDGLLQRFGRLDRAGDLGRQGIIPQARVVVPALIKDKDPVYGEALANTWRWLTGFGSRVDFGICSEDGGATVRERLNGVDPEQAKGLRRESPPAPALLPAHLDLLVQTSPRPAIDLDPDVFLHGREKGRPDVQVIWRADLDSAPPEDWGDIVALCPPVSTEAMPVPLYEFQRWLAGESTDAGSDVEGADGEVEDTGRKKNDDKIRVPVLRWRGDQSDVLIPERDKASQFRAGDTLILPEASKGWEELGHIPEQPVDAAERARASLRRGAIIRLFPALILRWPETDERAIVLDVAARPAAEKHELVAVLSDYARLLPQEDRYRELLTEALKRPEFEAYPQREGQHVGWVLSKRYAEADYGQDESSATGEISLDAHLRHVTESVRTITAEALSDNRLQALLVSAAEFHDCGKADARFQALLRGGDPVAARYAPQCLAKGKQSKPNRSARQMQWKRSGLPDGFRHELVSLALLRAGNKDVDDLVLHLVASHHGRCRPFAPVVEDYVGVDWNGFRLTREQASELAGHYVDSGVADRFWRLTRQFGWWGLAYLETLLRLGDWKASWEEARDEKNPTERA